MTSKPPALRLAWVEVARLLATLSVITQHLPCKPCPPNAFIIGPALALFFFLSGFFASKSLDQESIFPWLKKRLSTLVCPYITFCVAYWVLGGMSWSGDKLFSVFGLGVSPDLTPLWFLRDLMIFTLVSVVLRHHQVILFTLGLFCLFLNRWDDSLSWPSPYMFGDFILGMMLGRVTPGALGFWEKLPVRIHASIVLASVALLVINCCDTFFIPNSSLGVLLIPGFLSFGLLCAYCSPSVYACLTRWSSGSFFVYCIHLFVIIFFVGVESMTCSWPAWLWWCFVPLIYASAHVLYLFFHRFLPKKLQIWLAV